MERLKKRYAAAVTAVGGWLRAVGDWCGRHRIASIIIGGVGFVLFWSWLHTAVRDWCKRHPIASIIIGGVGFGLFWSWLVGGWWLAIEGPRQALAAYAELPAKEKVEAFAKLATAVGLLVAAPFAFAGVLLALWRTWNQHRDTELATRKLETESELAARKLDAEAFAKAVEQLGHAEIAIRMGAVLALQNLAEASPRRLLGQTLEILCAYVREKRPRTKEADEQPAVPLPTDVKLTLQVISRLNRLNADGKIPVDLSNTDLRGAELGGASLASVIFSRSNLRGASLSFANLQDASLWEANLRGAYLPDANLQDARLVCTKLQDADLMDANLQGADLRYAKLENADLQNAIVNGANLRGANLTGTILENKADASG